MMTKSAPLTRQNIVDTASDLIWKYSYASVSIDDICKAANVRKGSFYHFFPSKVDLVIAVMEECYQSKKAAYDEIFSKQNAPLKRFEDLADFMYNIQETAFEKHGQVCGCPFTSLGSEMAAQEKRIRDKLNELNTLMYSYYDSAIKDLIAQGLLPTNTNSEAKAKEIYTFLVGLFTIARIQNNLELLKQELKPGLFRTLGISEHYYA